MEQRNIALRLSYTGTAYHGWQVQKNAVLRGGDAGKGPGLSGGPPGEVHRGGPHRRRGPRSRSMWPTSAPPPASPCDRLPLAVNTRLPGDIVVVQGHARCLTTSTPSAPV